MDTTDSINVQEIRRTLEEIERRRRETMIERLERQAAQLRGKLTLAMSGTPSPLALRLRCQVTVSLLPP